MLSYLRDKCDDLTFAIFDFIEYCLSREGFPITAYIAWSFGSLLAFFIMWMIVRCFL